MKTPPIRAKDLIKPALFCMPSSDALKELQLVLDHNDSLAGYQSSQWISQGRAIEMLKSWGFDCGRKRIDGVCRALGRKGFRSK